MLAMECGCAAPISTFILHVVVDEETVMQEFNCDGGIECFATVST